MDGSFSAPQVAPLCKECSPLSPCITRKQKWPVLSVHVLVSWCWLILALSCAHFSSSGCFVLFWKLINQHTIGFMGTFRNKWIFVVAIYLILLRVLWGRCCHPFYRWGNRGLDRCCLAHSRWYLNAGPVYSRALLHWLACLAPGTHLWSSQLGRKTGSDSFEWLLFCKNAGSFLCLL